jgi:uncharacterized membrane protein
MPRRRIALTVLGLVGLAIASYLTYAHYAGVTPICTGSGSCEKVQTSRYADVFGVPVALIGLVSYVGLLATVALGSAAARASAVVIGVAGAAFSGYLTFLELFKIDAVCQWCVGSAVVMTAIAVIAITDSLGEAAPARP